MKTDLGSPSDPRGDFQPAAETLETLGNTEEPKAIAGAVLRPQCGCVKADPIVLDTDAYPTVVHVEREPYVARPGVLEDVMKQFSRGLEQQAALLGRELLRPAAALRTAGDAMAPLELLEQPLDRRPETVAVKMA